MADADGYATQVVGGANAQQGALHVYDLAVPPGIGMNANGYPVLTAARSWRVADLFPRWMSGQNLRDVTAVRTSSGYQLAGLGRVYYNTSPRATTQINVREIVNDGTQLGATREIAVDLPEQEFSGFIKHSAPERDLLAIGAGAYDSGQGSVAGLSYAVRESTGTWTRLLRPPGFGDVASPRLPRDTLYSCPDGTSWVCVSPSGGKGVWSTERIGGGGVRYGDNVMFIPTLGYGDRRYSRQSYTFGDASLDQSVVYFFRVNASTGAVAFASFDKWIYAAAGEPVIGVALGRVRGVSGLCLFVVKSMAWRAGAYQDGSVLQVFRITGR